MHSLTNCEHEFYTLGLGLEDLRFLASRTDAAGREKSRPMPSRPRDKNASLCFIIIFYYRHLTFAMLKGVAYLRNVLIETCRGGREGVFFVVRQPTAVVVIVQVDTEHAN